MGVLDDIKPDPANPPQQANTSTPTPTPPAKESDGVADSAREGNAAASAWAASVAVRPLLADTGDLGGIPLRLQRPGAGNVPGVRQVHRLADPGAETALDDTQVAKQR